VMMILLLLFLQKQSLAYRFSSLVKQNKEGKNYAVCCFAGFFF